MKSLLPFCLIVYECTVNFRRVKLPKLAQDVGVVVVVSHHWQISNYLVILLAPVFELGYYVAMEKQGIFIVIEGIDGAGKTTQAKMLADALAAAGETVVASKEPTDGIWGRKIRESAQSGRMNLDQELEAFIEDRKEHVAKLIQPALARGEVVILDRYFYSTIAYQGSRGANYIEIANKMRSLFPIPDIVLLYDIAPEISLNRIAHTRGDIPNHFEKIDSLREVRTVFGALSKSEQVFRVINASSSIDLVFQETCRILLEDVLKKKRCAKPYDCDIFYCTFRQFGQCSWSELHDKLALKR